MRVVRIRGQLVLFHVLTLSQYLSAREDQTAISPQNCSLRCVLQGGPDCEYCRINREEVEINHGVTTFGGCIPLPCSFFMVGQDSVCKHYTHAPRDITIEFLADQNPEYDNIIVSWKPSVYGIGFLRGFQVLLQALGGSHTACQLFLFQSNISLSASHAQRVYQSDPFYNLDLGSRYVVTVMALPAPVPEDSKDFYSRKDFSTQTCPKKNGLDHCKTDWYPKYTDVQQIGPDIIVTFNLAPPLLGIDRYFSKCYGDGLKDYTIKPDVTRNRTHSSYHLEGLKAGSNYTCEIAADQTDAVRKVFNVQVKGHKRETPLPLATWLPVAAALAVLLLILLLAVSSRKMCSHWIKRKEVFEAHPVSSGNDESVSPITRVTPPRLLICYCSDDGPAHVRAVMQLATFLQQYMATQVFLDKWDSLRLAEDGVLGWHCRRIQESDFVLVICSRGLRRALGKSEGGTSTAVIALIGEELGRAKATGRDISKYMAAKFEYSEEEDIPLELGFVSRYTLTRDLPLLFSHIHQVALYSPGAYLQIEHITQEGSAKQPAWAALEWSIHEAGMALSNHQESSGGEQDLCDARVGV